MVKNVDYFFKFLETLENGLKECLGILRRADCPYLEEVTTALTHFSLARDLILGDYEVYKSRSAKCVRKSSKDKKS